MIGIIGGSGFYNFIEDPEEVKIDTPFGNVTFEFGKIGGKDIYFIPRHGKTHSILPSKINYRANIHAAFELSIEKIIATNAVGSLRKNIAPGMFTVPDQIIDFTHGRNSTFFDGGDYAVTTRTGKELSGVVHTDVTQPFDEKVRAKLLKSCNQANEKVVDGGTIVVTNGPRFETPAEIKAYAILGCDFAGMTSAPEAFLAKEVEIPYATLAIITNLAAGLQKEVSHEEVAELFRERIDALKKVLRIAISS